MFYSSRYAKDFSFCIQSNRLNVPQHLLEGAVPVKSSAPLPVYILLYVYVWYVCCMRDVSPYFGMYACCCVWMIRACTGVQTPAQSILHARAYTHNTCITLPLYISICPRAEIHECHTTYSILMYSRNCEHLHFPCSQMNFHVLNPLNWVVHPPF